MPSVINVFSLKPINQENYINIINEHSSVISIENHSVIGGLGSLLSDIIAENGLNIKIDKLGFQWSKNFFVTKSTSKGKNWWITLLFWLNLFSKILPELKVIDVKRILLIFSSLITKLLFVSLRDI